MTDNLRGPTTSTHIRLIGYIKYSFINKFLIHKLENIDENPWCLINIEQKMYRS